MNGNELLDVLGEIDEALLLECEDYTAQVARRRKIMTRTAAGVCAVLALTVSIRVLPVFDREYDHVADSTFPVDTEAVIMQSQNSGGGESVNTPTFTYAETLADAAEEIVVTMDDTSVTGTDELSEAEKVLTEDAADAAVNAAPKKDLSEEEVEWEELPEVDASPNEPADIPAEVPVCDEVPDAVPEKSESVITESISSAVLPTIPLEEIKDAFGFEGILLYADDVYCSFNLLDQYGTPETLPAYKNLAFYDYSGRPVYLSDDVMLAQGQDYAARLGFEVLSYETGYTWDEEDIPGDMVILQTSGGEIRVQGNGFTTIAFAEPIALSGNRRLRGEISDKAAEKTTAYLCEQYHMLLDGNDCRYSLTCHRSFDGEPHRDFDVFTVSDDVQKNYFNASFADLRFFPGESDDTLGGIHIRRQAGALEKLGDYPLISEEEAREMLFAGEYITTVPADYMTDAGFCEDAILSCELEYRPSNLDTYYIPYYHYYVRLDNFPGHNMAEGLEHYGGYWVPAVHPDYLDTSMVTDGRFN